MLVGEDRAEGVIGGVKGRSGLSDESMGAADVGVDLYAEDVSSWSQSVVDATLLAGCAAGVARDDEAPAFVSKSRPSRKSISLGLELDEPDVLLLAQAGGGASGAGRGVALLLSIDSREANDSVRPPSISNSSPTFRSWVGGAIEGIWSRKEKSSAESAISL